MVRMISIMLILLTPTAYAANPVPVDKQLHAAWGWIISEQLRRETELSYTDRIAVVSAVGMVKEAVDVIAGGEADSGDILAGMAGAAINIEWEW